MIEPSRSVSPAGISTLVVINPVKPDARIVLTVGVADSVAEESSKPLPVDEPFTN